MTARTVSDTENDPIRDSAGPQAGFHLLSIGDANRGEDPHEKWGISTQSFVFPPTTEQGDKGRPEELARQRGPSALSRASVRRAGADAKHRTSTSTMDTMMDNIDNVEIVDALAQKGYAVVPLLSQSECDVYVDRMWTWIEGLGTGVLRDDPATWGTQWPGHLHGIFKCYGAGQAPFMWSLRTDPRVLSLFSYLWRTPAEQLLCSFDGCSIMRPQAYWPCKWELEGRLHVDISEHHDTERRRKLSNLCRAGIPCIQGLVTMADMDETTGTFACIPGSHLRFRNPSDPPTDWYRLRADDLASMPDPVRLRVPAGSLVLWDSRTAHCGAKPMPHELALEPKPEAGDRLRYVAYVSYMPRTYATTAEMQRRREAFERGQTTGHWAYPVTPNPPRIRRDKHQYTVTLPPLESYLDEGEHARARGLIGYEPM